MSNLTQFGGGVKSIQRGSILLSAAVASNTATITSVDTTKATIEIIGSVTSCTDLASTSIALALTNATTVTATRTGTTNSGTVYFQVTEYN